MIRLSRVVSPSRAQLVDMQYRFDSWPFIVEGRTEAKTSWRVACYDSYLAACK